MNTTTPKEIADIFKELAEQAATTSKFNSSFSVIDTISHGGLNTINDEPPSEELREAVKNVEELKKFLKDKGL